VIAAKRELLENPTIIIHMDHEKIRRLAKYCMSTVLKTFLEGPAHRAYILLTCK
jgi:hypothetical protein